ncbi:unnamed protein product [Bemisia tabaci]|uniref:Nucleolar protein 14 n=1 Tax=Bemisia tabaci TaxID=7038 RepID=A0A9P0F384_BEMTA|nr:unnamed protein product [Bemisia tabaci]
MAKVRNNRGRKRAGPKPKPQTQSKPKMNPFEIHINKSKHQVLGKKAKNAVGYPGIARHKAIQKRKVSLLQEYKIKDKANKFLDKRIGERNSAMTNDDRIMARFTAERLKEHKTKKSIFNLDDDAEINVLTHRGRTLEDVEKFDDPRSDDEDEENVGTAGGRLDADFVEEAHFGGGLLSKSNKPNNHQDLIEKLILESKKRKAEKMMNKEKTLELTQKLDATWKELIPLVSASSKKPVEEATKDVEGKDKNSYDVALRQLKFEARGLPSDKLKSEEEIIREEKERLESLEAERLRRMKGIEEDKKIEKPKHQSADDLDDCFYGSDNEDDETLTYNNEGRPISGILKKLNAEADEKSARTGSSSSEESGEEDSDSSDSEKGEEGDEDGNEYEGEGGGGEESDSSEDDLSDLKSDSSDDNDSDNEGTEDDKSENLVGNKRKLTSDEIVPDKKTSAKKLKSNQSAGDDSSKPVDDGKADSAKKVRFGGVHEEKEKSPSAALKVDPAVFAEILKRKKLLMESARKELPYTFKAPESYEELENVLANRTAEQKAVILERMIKCNHPSLLESNKEKLKNLFALLLQHLHDLASSTNPLECWSTLDCMAPYLYDLCQFCPESAGNCLREVIKEKQNPYRKLHRSYPSTDTLLFFKLISLLYPTSDLRHPVVTPCIILMLHILHQCRLESRKDIASSLFIIALILEYTELSKRYAPEVVNVIQALLSMASPDQNHKVCLPGLPRHKVLVLSESFDKNQLSANKLEITMKAVDLSEDSDNFDDNFKLRVLATIFKFITQFAYRYNSLPASPMIFAPIKNSINKLQVEKYPDFLSSLVEECNSALETAIDKKLEVLTKEKEKPKILKLYEPKIVPVYDMKFLKEKEGDPKAEHVKLLRTYRKEMKGAMREIRRDKDFISRIKFKEQAKSDAERRQKVKEIYSWGAAQQGELNQMARKKKKK